MGVASVATRLEKLALEAQQEQEPFTGALPLHVCWGVYARQSTMVQVTNNIQSFELQTQDLVLWLHSKGVVGKIELFDEDLGVSGSLRIDQRTGLQRLVDMIKAGTIKAILVANVPRLFRDNTGVQYNVFAQVCAEYGCILVTADGLVLNFRNPLHLRMFRYLAEMAADYLTSQIKYQQDLRMRKALSGKWAGYGNLPKGLMVDYNTKSPTYEKFIPYAPHVEPILEMFIRHYELRDFAALCREYENKPFIFPPLTPDVDMRNRGKWKFKELENGLGYHVTRSGMISILTNVAYIGWFIIAGQIVSKTNHPAIIKPEHQFIFWYSFNTLSVYTIEGEANEERQYTKRTFYQRRTGEERQGALLKDRIQGPQQIKGKMEGSVYAHYDNRTNKTGWHYVSCLRANVLRDSQTVAAPRLDEPFEKLFVKLLQESKDSDTLREWLEQKQQEERSKNESITQQLAEVELQQRALVDELMSVCMEINRVVDEIEREKAKAEAQPYIERIRTRSKELEATKQELLSELPQEQEVQDVQEATLKVRFQNDAGLLSQEWDTLKFAEKKEFVNRFVLSATLEIMSTHWLELTIQWDCPIWQPYRMYIYRSFGACPQWTEEEKALVQECFGVISRDGLCQRLPNKSWSAILCEARVLGKTKEQSEKSLIKLDKNITWDDHVYMSEKGIPHGSKDTIYEQLCL